MLASGRNVNVLVLDTEVYSNTGGQMSKATPLGAVAKFAAAGKTMPTKDLALQAIALANVYVARVAMGADPQQTLTAFREAEAYEGPSLVIAYSHCIAHGYDMRDGLDQQYRAVGSGHWPLIRYDPVVRADGGNPFLLDSPRPRMSLADYRKGELRFRALAGARAGRGGAASGPRPGGRRPPLADLRGDGHPQREQLPPRRPQGAVMSLATSYMGLRAPKPARGLGVAALVHARRESGVSPTPASARSCCSRSSRSSCARRRPAEPQIVDGPAESFAEALDYVPADRQGGRRPCPLPGPASSVPPPRWTFP